MRKNNLSQNHELSHRRNPCLVVNACYPLFGSRSKPYRPLCCAKVNWCIGMAFQQMSAELSSHRVVLFSRQSYRELMESFRTVVQAAFYLTRLMEGYFHRHKTCMDIFAQVASIFPVTRERPAVFRKATLYPNGYEGAQCSIFQVTIFSLHSHQNVVSQGKKTFYITFSNGVSHGQSCC